MYITVEGTVEQVLEPKTFNKQDGTSFVIKSLIVQTQGYKKTVPVIIEYYMDNKYVSDLNNVKVGDGIAVKCELSSREYNGSWYSKVQVQKIENIESHNTQQQQQPVQQTQPQQPAQQSNNPMQGIPTLQQNGQSAQQSAQTDDLPF